MARSPIIPHLELRPSQSLVMTPQLQQAIKLLQMNNIELNSFIAEELEKNPLLEREEDVINQASPLSAEEKQEENLRETKQTETLQEERREEASPDTDIDADYANTFTGNSLAESETESQVWQSETIRGKESRTNFSEDYIYSLDNIEDDRISLREHLTSQINIDIKEQKDRIIAIHLIDFLDDAGYLQIDLSSVAKTFNCKEEEIEAVINKVQGLHPVGVFARNLKECLALQLKERNRLDPAMQAMLDNLELLGKKEFKALEKICGEDSENIAEMVNEILSLDPKPASGFENEKATTLVPDVLMKWDKKGQIILELNPDTLPKVLLNSSYVSRINDANLSKGDRKIANNYLASANWLIKALHQRSETILKISTAIVSFQKDFFAKGIEYLKPLTLRDIASEISMHESTVSRVTTGKYIATPIGVFELKYFFSTSLVSKTAGFGSEGGLSAKTVQHRIKTMIDGEEAEAILSDEQIAYLLKKEGIEIARRTVAKYREALGIPTSSLRRREKRIKSL